MMNVLVLNNKSWFKKIIFCIYNELYNIKVFKRTSEKIRCRN